MTQPILRRRCLVLGASAGLGLAALHAAAVSAPAPAASAPVGEALQRPALPVREPERAVLLAAAWAGERIVAIGERGIVALSDDAGAYWRQAPCPVSVTLTAVRFADARQGVAVGHGGVVLTTADGGDSWTLRLDGRRLAQLALDAARSDGERRDAERLLADGPDKPFLDVQMLDARRIVAVGAYGIAYSSDDGGQRWAPWMARLDNPKGLHLYVLRRRGSTLLLAGEQGLLLRSDDDGASFKRLATPYKGSWFTGELAADPSQMLLAGLRGNVWRSSDAGASWRQLAVPQPASIVALAEAADGTLLLANQAGLVLRLQGDTLRALQAAPVPLPSGLLPLRQAGQVLTLGVAGAVIAKELP